MNHGLGTYDRMVPVFGRRVGGSVPDVRVRHARPTSASRLHRPTSCGTTGLPRPGGAGAVLGVDAETSTTPESVGGPIRRTRGRGGIGIRRRLKIFRLRPCGFESRRPYHLALHGAASATEATPPASYSSSYASSTAGSDAVTTLPTAGSPMSTALITSSRVAPCIFAIFTWNGRPLSRRAAAMTAR